MMYRILLCLAMLPLCGCNDHSMTQQNRYVTYGPAGLFADNAEAQALPAGVVAQGDLERAERDRDAPRCRRGTAATGP